MGCGEGKREGRGHRGWAQRRKAEDHRRRMLPQGAEQAGGANLGTVGITHPTWPAELQGLALGLLLVSVAPGPKRSVGFACSGSRESSSPC